MMADATAESPTTILPVELMIEILARVDSNNPLQLRSVCKWWKSLVVDDQFVQKHLHKSLADITDLLSTATEHRKSFVSHQIPNQLQEEEEEDDDDDDDDEEVDEEEAAKRARMNRLAELDNLLVGVRSIKRELEIIKVDTLAMKDRMKCLESFLKIYLKSATSSSSQL
ncbi:putative F-box domain-containing protein [Medicago truncatula]|uniref:Cyclin-like F-box n=2 Tax=Medicago truncatula TaxID=3880 RepID=A2Q241_MEDTR|nr:protein suppressor of hairy wing [Medicago truncatula]ABN09760.1 Cyclin-like F-box [Medicago truncatula]RHN72415.1 putative F-box domain-containing protein [Medicago truncatula]